MSESSGGARAAGLRSAGRGGGPIAGVGRDDELGHVFAALADPTRRAMIDALLRDGTTSVPTLSAELPITRQAVAKHLATLDDSSPTL